MASDFEILARMIGTTTDRAPERTTTGELVIHCVRPSAIRANPERYAARPPRRLSAADRLLLEGREREELDAAMGMHRDAIRMPGRDADGTFVVHTVRPSDLRRELARRDGARRQ